jgi:hypothetical protein
MSIETLIAAQTAATQANTVAITALHETWAKLLLQGQQINTRVESGEVTTVTAGTAKIAVATPKPVATPPATVTATPTPEATAPVEVAAAPSEPVKIELKDLSAAVTAAATRNRDGLVALLGKHNVKRASELPQDKWAALVAELEAL